MLRPRKTVRKRPQTIEEAVDSPRYKALLTAVRDAVDGPLESNAAAYARAIRTEEKQIAAVLQMLSGGAGESGWSAASAPALLVCCGRCSPLDEPIRGCSDCRMIEGSGLLDIEWPILVIDAKQRVRWANREAYETYPGKKPTGKLLKTVLGWGSKRIPIELRIETVRPYQGNRETFRKEKSRFYKAVGLVRKDDPRVKSFRK